MKCLYCIMQCVAQEGLNNEALVYQKESLALFTWRTSWIAMRVCSVSDVDDCLDITKCAPNGACNNIDGSFTCICNIGYMYVPQYLDCFGKCNHWYQERYSVMQYLFELFILPRYKVSFWHSSFQVAQLFRLPLSSCRYVELFSHPIVLLLFQTSMNA